LSEYLVHGEVMKCSQMAKLIILSPCLQATSEICVSHTKPMEQLISGGPLIKNNC